MKKFGFLLLVVLFVSGMVAPASALWGFPASLTGDVRSVSRDMITIASKAEDGQAIKEVSFEVTTDTRLEKIASIDDLKKGDPVKIKYTEDGPKKVAVQIARNQPSSEGM